MVALVITNITNGTVYDKLPLSPELAAGVARSYREKRYSAFGWQPLPDGRTWHGINAEGDELIMEIVELKGGVVV